MPGFSRRAFMGSSTLIASAAGTAAGRAAHGLRVTHLRAAQLENPLGLADRRPTLSWRIEADRRGTMQSAYRVRVASSREALQADHADLWDSGRIVSDRSIGIAYGGPPLSSRMRAWWSVTVYDDAGARTDAAEPAWFETGLLDQEDWSARWLAVERADDKADREAGLPWVAVPLAKGIRMIPFRLPFTTDAAGEVLLTLACNGFLQNVTIDGQAIAVPFHPYESFGGPPALRTAIPLRAGSHMLAAEATPPRGFTPASELAVAAQLRAPAQSGGFARFTTGWQTSPVPTGEWRRPDAPGSRWVAAPVRAAQPAAPWPPTPAMMLRRPFSVTAPVRRARLYVAALGAYEIHLNGRRVGDDLLQGETSDFRKTILHRTYDVTGMVRAADNVIGALVGDGWYGSYAAPVGRYAYGPAPRRCIVQLEIDHGDGSRTVVASGEEWRMMSSAILSSELLNGETYDARLEQPGWATSTFDDAAWTPCWPAETPPGKLVAQAGPAIRVTRTLKPVATTRLPTGAMLVDFGQNFAGVVRLTVKGKPGAMVTLRHAEVLKADGAVDQSNLRAARATDRYTMRGDPAGETFVPHFTYHGFRYVQIEGLPESWSVEGLVTGSDLPETGTLRIADPTIQKLWLNTLWSQRSNFVAIPTDCPQRDERLGWTGDAQVFWDTAAYNMDVASFTRRFLHDLRDAQTPKGAFPMYVPIVDPPIGASPGWADAGVMLPWICWRRYGDTALVAEHWDAMVRYVDGVIADNPDLVWRKVMGPNFADWLSLDAKTPMDETTPRDLVGTAMLKRSLDQLADMGEAIGKPGEAARFRAQSAVTARVFQAKFVAADGMVGTGSHTGYILAIRLGLLTAAQEAAAGGKLVADIRRRGTLLSTGFLGTPLSLDALADIGAIDLVYDLLLRTDFPSWGYMVRKGATTIWERWNGDTGDVAMNSFNHYALGAVCGFLYRRVAGIEEMEPGFAAFRVKPLIDPRVPGGGADYQSVRGLISTRWARSADGGLSLNLVVPPNARAEIHLPRRGQVRVTEGGRAVTNAGAVKLVRSENDVTVIAVGSGHYAFRA